VVREAETLRFCLTRKGVEHPRQSLPVIESLSSFFREPRKCRPLVADRFRVGQYGGSLLKDVEPQVRRGRSEIVLPEQRRDLCRSAPKISRELDLLITGGCYFGQRPREIRLHQVTNRVKLQAHFGQVAARRDCGAGRADV